MILRIWTDRLTPRISRRSRHERHTDVVEPDAVRCRKDSIRPHRHSGGSPGRFTFPLRCAVFVPERMPEYEALTTRPAKSSSR